MAKGTPGRGIGIRCRICTRNRRIHRHHVKVFPQTSRPFVTRQELGMGMLLALGVWLILAPWVMILFLS